VQHLELKELPSVGPPRRRASRPRQRLQQRVWDDAVATHSIALLAVDHDAQLREVYGWAKRPEKEGVALICKKLEDGRGKLHRGLAESIWKGARRLHGMAAATGEDLCDKFWSLKLPSLSYGKLDVFFAGRAPSPPRR